jgi:hypothetical protein
MCVEVIGFWSILPARQLITRLVDAIHFYTSLLLCKMPHPVALLVGE